MNEEKIEKLIEEKIEEKEKSEKEGEIDKEELKKEIINELNQKTGKEKRSLISRLKEGEISRREFLKTLGLSAGTLALSSSAAAGLLTFGSNKNTGPDAINADTLDGKHASQLGGQKVYASTGKSASWTSGSVRTRTTFYTSGTFKVKANAVAIKGGDTRLNQTQVTAALWYGSSKLSQSTAGVYNTNSDNTTTTISITTTPYYATAGARPKYTAWVEGELFYKEK